MNIKITKKIEEANLITHTGVFHADEVFSTVILSKIIPEITLIRVPEVTDTIEKNAIVYDIGAGELDHHQFGGNGERDNGVKYAACGLVWKKYGKKMLETYNINQKEIEDFWNYIDKNLIQFIDANDNGMLPKLQTDYRNVHLAYLISVFNPKWDEEKTDSDEDFIRALNFAETIFDEIIKDTIAKFKAKEIVDLAIESSTNGVMILDISVPWKELLLSSKNKKAENIYFVVFPSKRGGYSVYAVPKEIGSFENKKILPQQWRGLRGNDLQKVTGIKSARFCHNAGFICTAEEKEDAIKLAIMANK